MKRVRFETPLKVIDTNIMDYDYECHSPRPCTEKQINPFPLLQTSNQFDSPRVITYGKDSIKKFEFSNSLPYPTVNKTYSPNFTTVASQRLPCNDLDLSILDSTCQEPRTVPVKTVPSRLDCHSQFIQTPEQVVTLNSVENNYSPDPPNILCKNDDFFLKRENIAKLNEIEPLCEPINKLTLEKDNNPLVKKTEIMKLGSINHNDTTHKVLFNHVNPYSTENNYCLCHHCMKTSTPYCVQPCNKFQNKENLHPYCKQFCGPERNDYTHLNCKTPPSQCNCQMAQVKPALNAVDKKAWALERYEQSKKSECLDIEQQNTVAKERREPTVSDLFKIIKLQNEQLQLLQEKVDKFIAASNRNETNSNPTIQNYVTEHVAMQSVDNEKNKISIGVMTSFEMVRTSTVINKEVIKQCEAQIQCNRSQISIREVVAKSQPVNINFLEGIRKKNDSHTSVHNSIHNGDMMKNTEFDDKTLNELSLYNVQVDNATTPQMSPEQSMYLDLKDYSDSDTDSDNPANVGWTYYNKVMTRVNGMLQDSDMPSSASALYRNTRQKCLMQIDKTNVSVTKRVTFGENPIEIQQPLMNAASTDTSLKMNQLAAKYLKNNQQLLPSSQPLAVTTNDVSFATKNYMERHKILQGNNTVQKSRPQQEIPKFLDITVLKQQPKFI